MDQEALSSVLPVRKGYGGHSVPRNHARLSPRTGPMGGFNREIGRAGRTKVRSNKRNPAECVHETEPLFD